MYEGKFHEFEQTHMHVNFDSKSHLNNNNYHFFGVF